MAGKHDVYVFPDPNGPAGTFKVRPAVAFASAGDRFSIRNLTGYEVDVTFPKHLMNEGTNPTPIDTSKVFHILVDADGFYQYQVYVLFVARGAKGKKGPKVRKRAHGESDPGVIIDP
jgi:hypothetical protein